MRHDSLPGNGEHADLPPSPLSQELWLRVADSLGLCPRHGRIVELVLRDASDEQIAIAMHVELSTIKTLLRRIRDRMRAPTRMQLASRVMATLVELLQDGERPSTG